MAEGGDGGQLTNADFRKLLMTPRPGASAPSLGEPNKDKDVQPAKKKTETSKWKKRQEFLKKVEQRKAEEKERDQKYRDRAEERRKGVNTDYKDQESLLQAYKAVATTSVDSGDGNVNERESEIEKSKFLGGDIEHTHLVKGLDFALLQKEKARLAKEQSEQGHENEEEEEVEEEDELETSKPKNRAERRALEKKKADLLLAKRISQKKKSTKTPQQADKAEAVAFRTRMARGVYNLLINKEAPTKNELFQPGRMAYVVDLESDFRRMTVPTTLIRSKADCPDMQKINNHTTSNLVITKLTQILSYIRSGTRQTKKMKRKEKYKVPTSQPGSMKRPALKKPVDEDLDMYGDLDTDDNKAMNIPEVKPASGSKANKRKSYFSKDDDSDSSGKSKEDPYAQAGMLAQKVLKQFGSMGPKVKVKAKDLPQAESATVVDEEADDSDLLVNFSKKKKKTEKFKAANTMDSMPDIYDTCFPGQEDMMSMVAYGSDDDGAGDDAEPSWKQKSPGAPGKKVSEKGRFDKELGEINRFIEKRKAEGGLRRTKDGNKKQKADDAK